MEAAEVTATATGTVEAVIVALVDCLIRPPYLWREEYIMTMVATAAAEMTATGIRTLIVRSGSGGMLAGHKHVPSCCCCCCCWLLWRPAQSLPSPAIHNSYMWTSKESSCSESE